MTVSAPALRAEILAVGTELLMGEVVNTNAAWLSEALAHIGVNVFYHATVGDNPARLKGVLTQAMRRSNIVFITGGLGPTDDDLTVSTLAELLNTPLVSDPESEERIRQFFIARDMPMSASNIKQALRPTDGEALTNLVGTAPGLFWDVTAKAVAQGWREQADGPCLIFAFPGVPSEMKLMWKDAALPRLHSLLPENAILKTRFLKFIGIGESKLGERLSDLMARESPTVSPYVGKAEVRVRIAAKAPTEAAALALIEPVEAEILSRLGAYCYGRDDDTLEQVIGQLLLDRQLQVAVAESCTGGLLSCRLTDVSGSANYIALNVVTYSNEAKINILGVQPATLEHHGAVSPETAQEMADGMRRYANADIAVSVTGIAGPTGGTTKKPVGLAYIAFSSQNHPPVVKRVMVNSRYPRADIKHWFSQYALMYLKQYLDGLLHPDQD